MTAIPFPIGIGVSGAPGSGKQPLIEAYVELSADFYKEHGQELTIIPNTGHTMEQKYDTAMGVFGDYKEHLAAHFLRSAAEQQARLSGASHITAGTIIENLAHGGTKVEDIKTGLQTPDMEQRMMKEMHTTTVMTFLLLDTFRYTFGFYLPLKASSGIILPGGSEAANDAYAQRIDMALRMIFQSFNIRIQVLEGTIEENAQEMHDTIVRIMENGPEYPTDAVAEGEPVMDVAEVTEVQAA